MVMAVEFKRVSGFRGQSGIVNLTYFDLVKGVVPEYMHCILLGVAKNLLHLWFSLTQTGKPYFIGKEMKQIKNI